MGLSGFLGRLAFAFLFITAGLQKLQNFDIETGNATMNESMVPQLHSATAEVSAILGQPIDFDVIKPFVPALFLTACGLEIVGGVLFVAGSNLGARMLMLFVLVVTPVMHNFWAPQLSDKQRGAEMIQFFKNAAILGALVFYVDMNSSAKLAKSKTE